MQRDSLTGKSALDLFPDLFAAPPGDEQADTLAPPPPDPDWLTDCLDPGDGSGAANIPSALVAIVPDGRRRLLFYAIVGPRLHTLYDLEALAFSANLVINDREMPHLEPVLRKGLRDYEKLFRPLIDALSGEGASLL